MRIVMLGWELPPHHTGGLGVACQGLLRALSRQGANVRFVMPRPPGRSAHESRVELIDMQRRWSRTLPAVPTGPAEPEFTVVSQRAFAAYGDVTPNRPWRDPPRSTHG